MPRQKSTKTDARERQTPRTKQNDDMELLSAVAGVEFLCDDWVLDQRVTELWAAS